MRHFVLYCYFFNFIFFSGRLFKDLNGACVKMVFYAVVGETENNDCAVRF